MKELTLRKSTGLISFVSVILAVGSMVYLESTFAWEGQHVETILTLYYEQGFPLRLAWFVFAVGCMLLIPLSVLLHKFCNDRSSTAKIGMIFGSIAGFSYMMGILRWVIPVHYLSQLFHEFAGNEIVKQNIIISFNVLNAYAGNCFGETIAPLAHGIWLIILGFILLRNRISWKWFGYVQILGGIIIAFRPLEYAGLETLGKMSDKGIMLWSLTFLVFGIHLLISKNS